MWNEQLVIDGVGHVYDVTPENRSALCEPAAYAKFGQFLHRFFHLALESKAPGYQLSYEEFTNQWTAEQLADVIFTESDVDVIAFHCVDIEAFFKDGLSPYRIGLELKQRWPERVMLYAPVDPLSGPAALDRLEEHVSRSKVDGLKVYPSNGIINPATGEMYSVALSDPELAYPVFEKARDLGIRQIAVHKAIPLGKTPLALSRIDDVGSAAAAFPDLTFEIVHAGWAFLDDTATLLSSHPNVFANLEAVANFAVRRPTHFAHILGTMLLAAGPNRIVFGTGAFVTHPQPVLRALANFEIPQELQEEYGYPGVTNAMKAKFLGGNLARIHRIDPDERLRALADDEWAQRRKELDESGVPHGPWRVRRSEASLAGTSA